MTDKFVYDYLTKKMDENEEFIVFRYYEMRVTQNLSEDDTKKFIELVKFRLEKLGYNVYLTGEQFIYARANRTVQPNELMIAVKMAE